MPFHTNSIGGIVFDSMDGPVVPSRQELQIFRRAGINSIGARKVGIHAKPFKLTTVKYVADFTADKDAMVTYLALIGSDPVAVVLQSIDWGNYLLIDVQTAEPPQAVTRAVNTIIPNPTVRQKLNWFMIGG